METLQLAPDDDLPDAISPIAALMAGKKVAPDATDLLMQDHRQVASWFRSYQATAEEETRLYLVAQICLHLEAHMAFEEEAFYAAARELIDDQELIDHAVEEHEDAKTIMVRLRDDPTPGPRRDQLVEELEAGILSHVDEEEGVLFPKVRASGVDLYALGRSLAGRRAAVVSTLTGKPIPPVPLVLSNRMQEIPA
jgi:hypothetical protein